MLKKISWMWVNLEKSVGRKWGRTWGDFNPVTPTFSVEWAMKVTCQPEGGKGTDLWCSRRVAMGIPVCNLEGRRLWCRDTEMLISEVEHLWVRARLGCRGPSSWSGWRSLESRWSRKQESEASPTWTVGLGEERKPTGQSLPCRERVTGWQRTATEKCSRDLAR